MQVREAAHTKESLDSRIGKGKLSGMPAHLSRSLIGLSLLSAVAGARGGDAIVSSFLKSSYCQQAGCVSQGHVSLAQDRRVQIYTLTSVTEAELRVYFLNQEAIGAAYVFPLADSWSHRTASVAAFFSAVLHTQLTAARVGQFADSPLNTALRLKDQARRFVLSNDVTSPPGDLTQRVLHVKYGRDLIAESEINK